MTDASHELLEREIHRLHNKLMSLECELWTLKDAFYAHGHVPEVPKESGIPWDKEPET